MHTNTGSGRRFPSRHRALVRALALHLALATGTLGVVVAPSGPIHAAKRTDKREIEARQAFAAGQYQQALDLYAELYADKVHPTYLRNIGRCYQNLKQPEKSINAFRDYLRQARRVSAAERAEVEGYIGEMEALQKQQAAAAAAAAPPPAPEPPPTLPIVPPVAPQHAVNVVEVQQPPPPAAPTPFYKKAWFWSVVGVAVVGGVLGGLYAGGVCSSDSKLPCTAADQCN